MAGLSALSASFLVRRSEIFTQRRFILDGKNETNFKTLAPPEGGVRADLADLIGH